MKKKFKILLKKRSDESILASEIITFDLPKEKYNHQMFGSLLLQKRDELLNAVVYTEVQEEV